MCQVDAWTERGMVATSGGLGHADCPTPTRGQRAQRATACCDILAHEASSAICSVTFIRV